MIGKTTYWLFVYTNESNGFVFAVSIKFGDEQGQANLRNPMKKYMYFIRKISNQGKQI